MPKLGNLFTTIHFFGKRTGPDLLRIGGKYSDNWHLNHMYDPQSTSSGSIMPAYQWLVRNELDRSNITGKMEAMVTLGVPYTVTDIANATKSMDDQALKIERNLYSDPDFASNYEADKVSAQKNGETFINMRDREIVALIAYLQRLGTDIKIKETNEIISQNQ
jgi:cytochrome c oxidase cbb3-type subunit I/II